MKGITPVVAVILLLLVTIAIVGFAFGFFQRVIGIAGSTAENQTTSLVQRTVQTIDIQNINGPLRTVNIRNTGTDTIVPGRDILIFVGGVNATCAWNPDPIGARASATCTFNTPLTCALGTVVKVTASGNEDSGIC